MGLFANTVFSSHLKWISFVDKSNRMHVAMYTHLNGKCTLIIWSWVEAIVYKHTIEWCVRAVLFQTYVCQWNRMNEWREQTKTSTQTQKMSTTSDKRIQLYIICLCICTIEMLMRSNHHFSDALVTLLCVLIYSISFFLSRSRCVESEKLSISAHGCWMTDVDIDADSKDWWWRATTLNEC